MKIELNAILTQKNTKENHFRNLKMKTEAEAIFNTDAGEHRHDEDAGIDLLQTQYDESYLKALSFLELKK